VHTHNRMKVALTILGRFPYAAVRPPLVAPKAAKCRRTGEALKAAGVGPHGAIARAA